MVNVDACTYAGDPRRLAGLAEAVETIRADVADQAFTDIVVRSRPDVIVHFAAESHVTRSESAPERFFHTNVEGTRRVLDAAEQAGTELVVHVSTDEVYGPCTAEPFREQDKLEGEGAATSAYARSKSLADDLALSRSQRLGVIVARPTNCFGQWQHPEKAIPRWTVRALRGRSLPVWGGGGQIRDWMHVEDLCAALDVLIERGAPRAGVQHLAGGPAALEPRRCPPGRGGSRAGGRCRCPVRLRSARPRRSLRDRFITTTIAGLVVPPRLRGCSRAHGQLVSRPSGVVGGTGAGGGGDLP